MNPIMFTIFGLSIRWYSVLLLVAMALGIFLLKQEAKKFGMNWDFIFKPLICPYGHTG